MEYQLSYDIPIKCTSCQHCFTETLEQLSDKSSILCPFCVAEISLTSNKLQTCLSALHECNLHLEQLAFNLYDSKHFWEDLPTAENVHYI